MVHDAESDSVEFEHGLFVGQQEERARIVKLFHDEVSSTMMAALFALESAKNALEAQNLPRFRRWKEPPSCFPRLLKKQQMFWKAGKTSLTNTASWCVTRKNAKRTESIPASSLE